MAWNPSPDVAAARSFGDKFRRPVVVVFSIDASGEAFHITTYGQTKKLCALAGAFGEQIADAVRDGVISPPEVMPGKYDRASVWTRREAEEVNT